MRLWATASSFFSIISPEMAIAFTIPRLLELEIEAVFEGFEYYHLVYLVLMHPNFIVDLYLYNLCSIPHYSHHHSPFSPLSIPPTTP